MEFADMHIHSEYSDDGDTSIKDLIEKAKQTHNSEKPITLIAVTDHESPLEEKIEEDDSGITIVPGIEFSARDECIYDYEHYH